MTNFFNYYCGVLAPFCARSGVFFGPFLGREGLRVEETDLEAHFFDMGSDYRDRKEAPPRQWVTPWAACLLKFTVTPWRLTLDAKIVRFSLRNLLLAMTVLCSLAATAGVAFNWIEQRRAFRAIPKFSFVESPESSIDSSQARAPYLLRLLGERGVAFMTMEVLDVDVEYSDKGERKLKAAPKQELLRAHALFPEATIYAINEEGDASENLSGYWLSPSE